MKSVKRKADPLNLSSAMLNVVCESLGNREIATLKITVDEEWFEMQLTPGLEGERSFLMFRRDGEAGPQEPAVICTVDFEGIVEDVVLGIDKEAL